MNLRPHLDHIVVKQLSNEMATKAGIILPDTVSKERSEKGEVVAVGPGKTNEHGVKEEMLIKVGDKVIFKKYAADEVKVESEDYLIMSQSDVIAFID